jgi:ferredoxin
LSDKITNFEVSIRKCSIFNLGWSWFVFILFSILGRKILGKTFIADNSCISCEKCKNSCPVKAIQLIKGKPKWNWQCENCQRCINICPNQSIQTSPIKLIVFIIVEIAMVFVLISFNQHYQLPFLANVFLYGVLFLVMTLFIDIIMNVLERVSIIRKLFEHSYTKKYRRYMVKEFKKTI